MGYEFMNSHCTASAADSKMESVAGVAEIVEADSGKVHAESKHHVRNGGEKGTCRHSSVGDRIYGRPRVAGPVRKASRIFSICTGSAQRGAFLLLRNIALRILYMSFHLKSHAMWLVRWQETKLCGRIPSV